MHHPQPFCDSHLSLHEDGDHLRTPVLTRQEDQVLGLEAEAAVHQVPVDLDLVAGDHRLDQAVDRVAAPEAGLYLPPHRPVVLAARTVHDVICHRVGNMFRSPLHCLTSRQALLLNYFSMPNWRYQYQENVNAFSNIVFTCLKE